MTRAQIQARIKQAQTPVQQVREDSIVFTANQHPFTRVVPVKNRAKVSIKTLRWDEEQKKVIAIRTVPDYLTRLDKLPFTVAVDFGSKIPQISYEPVIKTVT